METGKKSLLSSEWLLVASLLAILASLVILAKIKVCQAAILADAQVLASEEPVPVAIEGAVVKPGTYLILPGSTLGKALKKAKPKPHANLKNFDLNQRVEGPLKIVVEELKEIIVSVDGAVLAPTELRLAPKTRVCDLKSKIQVSPEADPEFIHSFLKGRRQLKDGEKISVPKKPVE